MCYHVHVDFALSADDKRHVKKLSGIMIPDYATILLAVVAMVAIGGSPRPGDMIAASSASSARR